MKGKRRVKGKMRQWPFNEVFVQYKGLGLDQKTMASCQTWPHCLFFNDLQAENGFCVLKWFKKIFLKNYIL